MFLLLLPFVRISWCAELDLREEHVSNILEPPLFYRAFDLTIRRG